MGVKSKRFQSIVGISVVVIVVLVLVSVMLRTNADTRSSAYSRPRAAEVEPRVTLSPMDRNRRPTMTPTPTISQLSFYSKTTSNITAQPGVGTTVVAGCDSGDIALSAGLESYGGPLNKWRTIRVTPSTSTDMNGMLVTLVNEDTVAHDFTITARCLKK